MKRIISYLFWTLIIGGFILRCFSLSYMGIFDMETYHLWGSNALNEGLDKAYQGTYYPFQYQVFEFCAWLAIKFKAEYFIIYKAINLLFDLGNLIVLFLIFRSIKVSKYYLLIYWLHPWFLLMFSQGYIDFQFTFFILMSIYISLKTTSRSYLIAGIFLAFAFLMKPQVQIVVLGLFIYYSFIYYKEKDVRPFQLFIFPAILFIDYSLYFFVESGNPFRLLRGYVDIGNDVPLTANFLNVWFPVAYYNKAPGDVIYAALDNLTFLHIKLRTIALLALFLLIFLFIKNRVKESTQNNINLNYFLVATFSTFIFPFVMTGAHENHLFLATVLLIPVVARVRSILAKICIHVILLIQFINMYGFYGAGDYKSLNMININYSYEKAFILSLIAFSAFLILITYFLNPKSKFTDQILKLTDE